MSFRDDRIRLQEQAHVDKTAGTLLEKMEKLRNTADGPSRRRWVWELVQNAVDVARPGVPLEITVSRGRLENGAGDEVLTFIHNGRPFSFKNLVYLAEQVSTKERHEAGEAEPETVGRFGTGFLTTHLLSERVTVLGVCVDDEHEPVAFKLPLDRSGATRSEMAEGVERSMAVLDELDGAERIDPTQAQGAGTGFVYPLDAKGLDTATAGLEDLHALMPYTLAFDGRIGSVEAPSATKGAVMRSVYEVTRRESLVDEIELVTVTVEIEDWDGTQDRRTLRFVVARGERVALALPAAVTPEGIRLLPVDSSVPRLHCAFPLVGTERFPFPAVVNSARFHPTEERDGVWLGSPTTPQKQENWSLMAEARGLLERVVGHATASGWTDLFALADFGSGATFPWLDTKYYGDQIRLPLQRALATAPLVETEAGVRKALGTDKTPGVWIPRGETEADRVALWDLLRAFAPAGVPKRDHIEAWHKVRWAGLPSATPEALANTVATAGTLEAWAERLGQDGDGAAEWITAFVAFLGDRKESHLLNRAGKGALPNQRGRFRLWKELFADDEIPDGLKNIADAFEYDVRAELLDARVFAPMGDRDTRTSADVAVEVRARAQQRLNEVPRTDATRSAFGQLLRWFHENPEDAKRLFGDLYASRHTLRSDEEVLEDMEKARQLDQLREVLAAHGVTEAGLAAALAMGGAKSDVQLAEERQKAVDYVSDLVRNAKVTTFDELAGFINAHPDKFQHHSQATLDGFLRFLAMTRRAKDAVRAQLCAHPDYDCSGWTEDEDYPTIVHGVRRAGHGREIYLVVRPSDGGKVILYYDLEPTALEDRDGELWVQDEVRGVRQVTLGMVFRTLREQLHVNQVPVA